MKWLFVASAGTAGKARAASWPAVAWHGTLGQEVAVCPAGGNGADVSENFVADPTFEAANEADDDYGHGTHVAGTIAASMNGTPGGVVGVAPEANLVALKTLDSSGVGAWSRRIAAIEHVWNDGVPLVDIVNMSIGWTPRPQSASARLRRPTESRSALPLTRCAGASRRT